MSATTTRRRTPARQTGEPIAAYVDPQGCRREIITLPGAHGSRLVVDRIPDAQGDERLIAHLCGDEPRENAVIVSGLYLRDERRPCCRPLRAGDIAIDPVEECAEPADASAELEGGVLTDSAGNVYSLDRAFDGPSLPQLRWHRHPPRAGASAELLTLRHLTGALEGYQPAVRLSQAAVLAHDLDTAVSVTVLRAELRRLQESPIVLNRGLREVVLTAIQDKGVSMSEIAIRCGRRKRDRRGCESGETSWLARRIGILPEGGELVPTPWVHSDVLALIARDGLGIPPREVEI